MLLHLLKLTIAVAGVLPLVLVFTTSMKDPKNPPTGQTGAPSETTCSTASGCHSGGNYTGTVALTGLPASLVPGTTYDLTLTLTSPCSKTGFEMTVLDKNLSKCGDLIAGANNNLKVAGNRQYIRQSNANTMSGGKSSYSFKWKAPAVIAQDTAIFYYVMLQANGNGNTSGDNVAKGVTKVAMPVSSGTRNTEQIPLRLYPNPVQQYLNIDLPEGKSYVVSLINSDGKVLQTFSANGHKVVDVGALASGRYMIRVTGQDGLTMQQFIISR